MAFQAQYVQEGQAIDYTPSSAVSAGDVVIIGDILGIAKLDIAADALGAIALDGVFDMLREASTAFTAGDAVYWDADGDPEGTTTSDGAAVDVSGDDANLFVGWAMADVADSATTLTVRVRKVNNGQAPIAANVAAVDGADAAAAIVAIDAALLALKAAGLMVDDA